MIMWLCPSPSLPLSHQSRYGVDLSNSPINIEFLTVNYTQFLFSD